MSQQNDYLSGLNERQREAVLHTQGPLLILAGAGAGKTKTLTHRILHLINDGVAPEHILAITFTNKAAKEMRERTLHLLSAKAEAEKTDRPFMAGYPGGRSRGVPLVSTFHSLGVLILKENHAKLGLPQHFTIFDKDDAKRAVKEAMEQAGIDPKQVEPAKIQSVISKEKGRMTTPQEYERKAGQGYLALFTAPTWIRYEAILAREKALDFDDLLAKTSHLLKNDPELLKQYQDRWRYIHIDEYQDTNGVQYQIGRMLAGEKQNICVVGDIDQNIYSWRGADIQNIINFEKDFPGAKVVLLEENYRSTQTILTAANRVIAKNTMRREKNLFTKNNEGEKIGIYGGYDEADEANFVAHKAGELIKAGTTPAEIAILYRANFQSRALEEAFLAHGIPYQLLGTRFFERKEIKDILSFIQAARTEAPSALARIINVPPRGIGKVTLEKIESGKEAELSPASQSKIRDFRTFLARVKKESETMVPSALIRYILKESGLEEHLMNGDDEAEERLLNIKELAALAGKYDVLPKEEALDAFLTDAALASDQDALAEKQDGVKLMTVHSSKGLEFDYVFITGLEENLFPHKRMSEESLSQEAEEEERRLFYVALTRGRKRVFLTHASTRTVFGSKQVNIPSEFISDIDEELAEQLGEKKKHRISVFGGGFGNTDEENDAIWGGKTVYL